jgi:deltex-like protein
VIEYDFVTVVICSFSSSVVGLIVARMKGKIVRVCKSLMPNEKVDANTIIGDKLEKAESQTLQDSDGWPIKDSYYEIVLRSSLQCLPMVKFDKALIGHKVGIECIRFLQNSLELILNERFNEGLLISDLCSTPLIGNATLTVPAFGSSHPQFNTSRGRRTIGMAGGQPAQQMTTTQSVLWGPQQTIGTTQSAYAGTTGAFGSNPSPFGGVATGFAFGGKNVPTAAAFSSGQLGTAIATGSTKLGNTHIGSSATKPTHNTMPVVKIEYLAPQSLSSVPSNALIAPSLFCNMDDDCAICHEKLKTSSCVALKICSHVFHKGCIKLAFQSKSQCPVCRVPVGAPQGKSPSGTMSVTVNPIRCSGFQCDTLVISYNIPAARQMSYHDNPGATHGSKVATAYVPNNEEGINLLKRLKFAFKHGLTFAVGTSMTSGMTDQCTW